MRLEFSEQAGMKTKISIRSGAFQGRESALKNDAFNAPDKTRQNDPHTLQHSRAKFL
jgi:hypothetical protein